ncbi:MAG: NAD-dependent epimerase/dehydratase family protein, partial [Chloroflexota bacterium]
MRALLAAGHQVRAAYRSPRFLGTLDGLSVERVRIDLEAPQDLREALEGCEWVFHAAAYYPHAGERREEALNRAVASTRRILDAFAQAKPARVVFTSSASTILSAPGLLAKERDAEPWPPTEPRTLYATVKIAIERQVERACAEGLPVVIVNPSVCLGEYDARPFSGRVLLAFAKHRLPFYIDHTFNAIYTGDVGVGHVRAAERGRLSERYLLTSRQLSVREFATLVSRAMGRQPPRIRIPDGVALAVATGTELWARLTHHEPLLPRQMVLAARRDAGLDGSKAVQELGLPQTPIEDAVRRTVAWFRAHG